MDMNWPAIKEGQKLNESSSYYLLDLHATHPNKNSEQLTVRDSNTIYKQMEQNMKQKLLKLYP